MSYTSNNYLLRFINETEMHCTHSKTHTALQRNYAYSINKANEHTRTRGYSQYTISRAMIKIVAKRRYLQSLP
jgi:hypothetical protein